MSRVAIVTIYGEENFGNKLQNYAVEQILIRHGHEVTTMRYRLVQTNSRLKNLSIRLGERRNDGRKRIFRDFSSRHLHPSDFLINPRHERAYAKLLNGYDYVVCGSDQIWNDSCASTVMLRYFLLHGVDEKKRVAVSPSVASERISNTRLFREELPKFSSLSCRERANARQLLDLSGKCVTPLMDPTLAIPRDEWEALAAESAISLTANSRTIRYVLGKTDDTASHLTEGTVDLMDPYDSYHDIGPSDFLRIISEASLVRTNSFHGMVFSLIFGTPFEMLARDGKIGGRVSNLFDGLLATSPREGEVVVPDMRLMDSWLAGIRSEWDCYITENIR